MRRIFRCLAAGKAVTSWAIVNVVAAGPCGSWTSSCERTWVRISWYSRASGSGAVTLAWMRPKKSAKFSSSTAAKMSALDLKCQ